MKTVRLKLKDAIQYALKYEELKCKKRKTSEECEILKIAEALRKGNWKVV